MKKTILFLFMASLIHGCVPVKYDYYYMSFEDMPHIKTLAYGKATINKLESHGPMPVSYELHRDKYILFIEIDQKSKRPASIIKAKSIGGLDLKVKAIIGGSKCGGFDFLTVNVKDDEFLRYEWWGLVKVECLNREISTNERAINLHVIDNKEKLLGEERLPFKLITNGIYIEQDAI